MEAIKLLSEEVQQMLHGEILITSSASLPKSWKRWLDLAEPCFWADLFAFVQVIFILYSALRLIFQKIIHSRDAFETNRDKCTDVVDRSGETSSGSLHMACRVCCLLMFLCHPFRIAMLILRISRGNCKYLSVLIDETVQSISWILLLYMAIDFKPRKCTKIPPLVRAWWTCSFVQMLVIAAIFLHSVLSASAVMGITEYVNLLMLLCSTFLFYVSVHGKSGIYFAEEETREPLLQTSEAKEQCPYGRANLVQLVTYSWMSKIFSVGFNRPLNKDDVPDVDMKDSAEFGSETLRKLFIKMEEKHGSSTLSIYKAMFHFIKKKSAINASFAVLSASISYVGPSLINEFVKFLRGERMHGLARGYVLALAFLIAKIIEIVAQRQWIFGARQLGMRMRGALISHIYQKGIILSSQSRQKHTSGEVINYMSVDIQRITDVMWYANYIWMLPIQIPLAIFVLHKSLGAGAFVALAVTVTIMCINVPLTRAQRKLQTKIMEAKDNRMKATTEVLRSMKILKLQAWDMHYLLKLEDLRSAEYKWLWKSQMLGAFTSFIFWGAPSFISSVTFGYCLLMGIPLTAGNVLSALATFQLLQDPIFNLPDLLSVLAQGKVSADRVATYLQEDEIKPNVVEYIPRDETKHDVEICNGDFSWNSESNFVTLQAIELKVERGMKVAICGTVGSGKSSLLSCILGEMLKVNGRVKVSGSKAYVPQSPWILSGTVRENILFGNPYDGEKYYSIIQACALTKDLELFANGDQTEIGERGINMSGGQKQRIQIARAVYQDADIYLLDDPFSAVDAHTGSKLFKDCLLGILKNKTVLYVTHQVEFLPAADLILVMQDGKIVQRGNFRELLKQNVGFEVLVGAHSHALESVLNAENSSRNTTKEDGELSPCTPEDEEERDAQSKNLSKQESRDELCDNTEKGRLTQDEEREKGGIGKHVYLSYMMAVQGGLLVPLIVSVQCLFQILQVGSNYWMAWASPPTTASDPKVGIGSVVLVYVFLAVGSAFCVLARAVLLSIAGLLTAEKFFKNMLHCIMRAPMSFFDSTPTGRILNRVSSDQSVLDMELSGRLGWCAFSIIRLLGTVTVMSQVSWPVFAIFIPVTIICVMYQRYYIPTARELARLSEIQKAPILHHFSESLAGAAIIRAFGQRSRFRKANISLADNHSRPWFHNICAQEWLSYRLNMLSNAVFAFALILIVSLPEGFIDASLAGLAVTYAMNLNSNLSSIIWTICNTENKMIAVERILQYTKIPGEAALTLENRKPPSNWPSEGTIFIKNLELRYAEHLPSVIKNITCLIPGSRKVGVVGRTGGGKSTLIQALFRIVEPRGGMIEIDNVDICKIGLHDLRSRLGIIPQDPTMFLGTVRGNLDPLMEYTDKQIWEVVDKCQLRDAVGRSEKKLDSAVVEDGENWSVGQRQLFCLGRVLLKRSNILVLDEATASVDSATDRIIQNTIREEFSECTVITIAHRIHTVIDSDLILVLGEGKILEYDTPSRLLAREDSAFSQLIAEFSRRSHLEGFQLH